ncbi:MAG: anhydro-N-acetylmuramic acid kinase [Pseudomonadota bacterium]
MHPDLVALQRMAARPARRIVGLMSGTSMDGLDIALCRVEGSGRDVRVELERFGTWPFEADFLAKVRPILSVETVRLADVCAANGWIGRVHGQLVLDALRQWGVVPGEVDLIASHGQTVYHHPKESDLSDFDIDATLQIGDGDQIARTTGIITLSDFRQRQLAAGGQGAPLVAYGDALMFRSDAEARILLNLGGIANFTHLPRHGTAARSRSTDCGPGNTLLDAYVRKHFAPLAFDEDAALAREGSVSDALLSALMDDPFLQAAPPKTTGPERFNLDYLAAAQDRSGTTGLDHADILRSLVAFSARATSEAMLAMIGGSETPVVYVSGGGAHNPLLRSQIEEMSGLGPFRDMGELGLAGDAKEAVLFAVLANECLFFDPDRPPGLPDGLPHTSMGKICLPR